MAPTLPRGDSRMVDTLAYSPVTGIEDPHRDQFAGKPVRPYAKKLFAEIAVRIVAFAADMVLVLFAMLFLDANVLQFVALDPEYRTATWGACLLAYFTASWASPLRATPMQFIFRMRVLHESGRALSPREAGIRAVSLVALWGSVLLAMQELASIDWRVAVGVVALMLYVPSVTARRQGLHDFVSHSVVLSSRALRSDDDEAQMRAYLSDKALATSRAAGPSVFKMITDAVALGIPLFAMVTGIQVSHQKNTQGRVAYAVQATMETRQLAEAWFAANGTWPQSESELGQPMRHAYPAGGYFQLEEDGAIRIQFEVLDELKNGSILFEPATDNGEVSWQCRVVGDIEQMYLPSYCR